jgi:DNA-binding XRE family transcriptional regulator
MLLPEPDIMKTMTADRDPSTLEQLAAHAAKRRAALGMTKAAVAAAVGVSINTYHRLETGGQIRDVTYAKVETVLGWAPGSCRDILNGAPGPVLVEHAVDGVAYAKVPAEDLRQAVTNAVVAVADNLTAAEIREVSRRTMEELKRRGLIQE